RSSCLGPAAIGAGTWLGLAISPSRVPGERRLYAAAWKDMQTDWASSSAPETGGRRPPESPKPRGIKGQPQRGARGRRNQDQSHAAEQGVVAGSICGEMRN